VKTRRKCNHEGTKARRHEEEEILTLRVGTQLPDALEAVIQRTIGGCIAVHRELGPGLLEMIYTRAVCLELAAEGIPFEPEKNYPVMYRGQFLCHQRLDLVVAGELVLEIKSVERLSPVHHAQLLNYLHVSKLRAGILLNFNVAVLKDGLRRVFL
jgi:GxxExxY protein